MSFSLSLSLSLSFSLFSLSSSAVYRMFCSACNGPCDKSCPSSMIDSLDAAQSLQGCTVIDGNLDINIRHGSEWFNATGPAATQLTRNPVVLIENCVQKSVTWRIAFFGSGLACLPLKDISPVWLHLIIIWRNISLVPLWCPLRQNEWILHVLLCQLSHY